MGFWDKVKGFFGIGSGGSDAGGDDAPPADAGAQGGTPYRGVDASAYDAGAFLGLSAAELRAKAMGTVLARGEWSWRRDAIPPATDDRTALIDRGLVLRGLLTDAQLANLHAIGDEWLRHNDAEAYARAHAAGKGKRALEEDRAKRRERKEQLRREAEVKRAARGEEIRRRRDEDIVFLGRGVSAGLADRRSEIEALIQAGLPVLSTPADVARAMNLSISSLRWLCFHAETAERTHYVSFEVPKKTGGTRRLSAPHARMRAAQSWIAEHVLAQVSPEHDAHGFVTGKSIVTNATPHVGKDVVINVDLVDFFPSIAFVRVRGIFESLGYSPAVATIFALLTTESPRRRVEYDGKTYFAAVAERSLPQGACTSPALSNLVARKLDRRLRGMCKKHGVTYTRYADDLTFSMEPGRREDIGMLLARIRHIVEDEGFRVHPKKVRVQRSGGRQAVTGIIVNHGLAAPREDVRRLRAILHAAKKTGLAAQSRGEHTDFVAHVRGKIAYVQMIDPKRGAQLKADFDRVTGGPQPST